MIQYTDRKAISDSWLPFPQLLYDCMPMRHNDQVGLTMPGEPQRAETRLLLDIEFPIRLDCFNQFIIDEASMIKNEDTFPRWRSIPEPSFQ